MARQLPRGGGQQGRRGRVVGGVRKLWPIALEGWRRWDQLPEHQKERYRKMAADYTRRGREAIQSRRGGGGMRPGRRR
jgi:hypothetical protein